MSDFAAWLAQADAERVLLADIGARSGGVEVTRYVSTAAYATQPTDPVHTQYLERLKGAPAFERRASAIFAGRGEGGFGELEILNADGEFDAWLDDVWQGRDVVLRLGDPAWQFADFGVIITGKIETLTVRDEMTLSLVFRDRHAQLDDAVQQTLINTGSPAGSGPNDNRPQPLVWGAPLNVTPVLIDDTAHTYQVHDGAVIDPVSQLYIDGLASAAGLTKDAPGGKFDLTAAAAGAVTVDCSGEVDDGSPQALRSLPGDIFDAIAARMGVTVGTHTLNADAPYALGLYDDAGETAAALLDRLLPAGWWYAFNRAGELVPRLLTPPGAAVLTIDDLETQGEIQLVIDAPVWRVTVAGGRNWTPGDFGADSTVSEARRAFLNSEYSVRGVIEDQSIKADYPDAQELDLQSAILSAADCQIEAQRLFDLFGVQRYRYAVTASLGPFQLELGDTVTLQDDRFGLAGGVACRVIGMRELLADNQVELELWR